MKLTDEIKKGLVGKNLICQANGTTLTEGKSYKVIRTEEYKGNKLDILVVVISDYGDERSYDLMWFVDKQKDEIIEDKSKLTFEQLEKSPIEGIELSNSSEKYLIEALKYNDFLISDNNGEITYNKIPELVAWLQNVYNYCSELKNNIVKYVDFNTAKKHMNNDNMAMFENETYYIRNGELYCKEIKDTVALKLRAIESDKWILL